MSVWLLADLWAMGELLYSSQSLPSLQILPGRRTPKVFLLLCLLFCHYTDCMTNCWSSFVAVAVVVAIVSQQRISVDLSDFKSIDFESWMHKSQTKSYLGCLKFQIIDSLKITHNALDWRSHSNKRKKSLRWNSLMEQMAGIIRNKKYQTPLILRRKKD